MQESTVQYMPPESIFPENSEPFDTVAPLSYDSWSVGVIFLELILGTGDVFSVDQRTEAIIRHRMAGSSEESIRLALLLASMAHYCIYQPQPSEASTNRMSDIDHKKQFDDYVKQSFDTLKSSKVAALSRARTTKCSYDQLAQAIQSRDPLAIGFHDR